MKHLVFDFDGTLVNSKSVLIDLYNQMALKQGYALMTPENLNHLRNLSIPQRCKYLNVPLYKIPFIAGKLIKQYREKIAEIEFQPGIADLFEDLKDKGISYSIISTNAQKTIEAFFSLKGLSGAQEILCSQSIFGKDTLIRQFLKKTGLSASQILYVGDELRDIEACKKCGVPIAWVSWGYDSAEAVKKALPDYIINSPDELLTLAY